MFLVLKLKKQIQTDKINIMLIQTCTSHLAKIVYFMAEDSIC
jgi:hypothetical protein